MTPSHTVEIDNPACPMRREPMRLIRLEPSFAGIPELRTFQCNECKLMMTMVHSQGGLRPRPPARFDGLFESAPTLVPRKKNRSLGCGRGR
jgi:hypothetical protein